MKMRILAAFAFLVGIMLVAPAWAVVAYTDDFEGAVATPDTWAQQEANPGTRTDNDPANTTGASFSAAAGQWFHYNKSGVPIHSIQVTNNPSPGAAEGNNYLRIHRGAGTDSANIALAFTNWDQPLTTGIVTASFKAYWPSANGGFAGGVYFVQFLDNDHAGGTDGSKPTLFVAEPGDIRVSENSFVNNFFPSSPKVTEDLWQTWTIVADLDTRQYTYDIDGVTSASYEFNFPGSAMTGLLFNGQEGAEWYVDAVSVSVVPEPAAMSLAAVAGLGLLARRRQD